MRFQALVQSYTPSFTKSEAKVAEFISENAHKVLFMTLQDLALETGVGEATVVRFCNKIGFNKFAELKLMIAQEPENDNSSEDDNILDFSERELVNVISDTKSLLSVQSINQAVDLMIKSHRIYFFGVGASGLTAKQAEAGFMRIGVNSNAVIDPHFQAMSASMMNYRDVVIAISISGATRDIYESLMIAKNNGARIIVLTNYVTSPIAQLADCVLLTAAKEHVLKGGTLGGTISQLFVCDVIKAEYTQRNIKDISKQREKIAHSIVNKSI